jgi:lipopolysaccharide heptosyltransferase II
LSQKNKTYSKREPPENLLILRTDRIGDLVLSLPLACLVKKNYPQCKITFLIRNYTKAILENHPCIDEIIILKEKENRIPVKENVKAIRQKNFNSCVIVYPTFATALIIYLSGIKERIGTGYRWYSILFNKKIYEHRKYAERHELEFNVNMLKALGIEEEVKPGEVKFALQVNTASQRKIDGIFNDYKIDKKKLVIIIHPGSGGSSVDLPPDKFKELVSLLSSGKNFQVIITGSEKEKKLCDQLQVNSSVINLAGMFNLSEMIALINNCNIFVANSTGPLHIAAALDKYTIGFYPKIKACSAKRWGPYSKKTVIFSPGTECEDCTREQCSDTDCMSSIMVTGIIAEIEKIHNLLLNNGEINV